MRDHINAVAYPGYQRAVAYLRQHYAHVSEPHYMDSDILISTVLDRIDQEVHMEFSPLDQHTGTDTVPPYLRRDAVDTWHSVYQNSDLGLAILFHGDTFTYGPITVQFAGPTHEHVQYLERVCVNLGIISAAP